MGYELWTGLFLYCWSVSSWAQIILSADKPSPREGDRVILSCSTLSSCGSITIWLVGPTGPEIGTCLNSDCISVSEYAFNSNGNIKTALVNSFSWGRDAFLWECQCGGEKASYLFSQPTTAATLPDSQISLGLGLGIPLCFIIILIVIVICRKNIPCLPVWVKRMNFEAISKCKSKGGEQTAG